MPEDVWTAATWEGNRRQQHSEYYALPFAEKLVRLEQLAEVSQWLLERSRLRREPPVGALRSDSNSGK